MAFFFQKINVSVVFICEMHERNKLYSKFKQYQSDMGIHSSVFILLFIKIQTAQIECRRLFCARSVGQRDVYVEFFLCFKSCYRVVGRCVDSFGSVSSTILITNEMSFVSSSTIVICIIFITKRFRSIALVNFC